VNQQIVVSDAGPLLALAKLEALDLLARLYHVVNTSPIVFDETVTQGLALNAADASLLKESFDNGILAITAVQSSNALDEPIKIHGGERESIQLAIQLRATEYLVDDSRARRIAEQNFSVALPSAIVRGTLGIIYLSFQQGYLPREHAIQLLETLKLRRDIWISTRLCDKVLRLVRT
jgi:predicted nucleic acid-binding protein